MQLALFNLTGVLFILRWLHVFFAVLWLGSTYYLEFSQSSQGNQNRPHDLAWVRWGSLLTVLTGMLNLMIRGHLSGPMGHAVFLQTSWGIFILMGSALGFLMWANVWFLIWPNHKLALLDPTRQFHFLSKASIASRYNILISIPMLFFMNAASHLPFRFPPTANKGALFGLLGLFCLGIEWGAIKGKKGPLASNAGLIHLGFLCALGWYALIEWLCLT